MTNNNEINASDVYYKLGEIHADVRGHEHRISTTEKILKNHDSRITTLETNKEVKEETSNIITKYLTRGRVILLTFIAIASGIVTIAYKLPNPQQQAEILKLEQKR
ncbi:hypothetical protein [Francisella marina]|uniref:hypothetical protein n=1 Tax=Francisella marina TaxID=2249302 RepID=UPI0011EF0207|nr:hypothetical protein [Francisella marina]QEO58309.1 hypothetical protein F0R75_00430 [Francisella marina]